MVKMTGASLYIIMKIESEEEKCLLFTFGGVGGDERALIQLWVLRGREVYRFCLVRCFSDCANLQICY
ncbi:hypothetical protein VTL71DRAFT_724 [Oculimacula yallundae]|uniref:Uncharacterized protein n=1 Tax=Oculimacula yallundae TaxID=86028 RepID=A0ABR4D360_9HELO